MLYSLDRGTFETIIEEGVGKGETEAIAIKGYYLCYLHNIEECISFLKTAAEKRNATAQYLLSGLLCSRKTNLIPKDKVASFELCQLSANQGNAWAQCGLGNKFQYGKGTPVNIEQAIYWYRIASRQGDSEAQCFLGLLFYKGESVAQDTREAMKLFRLAANKENSEAQLILGEIYLRRNELPEARKWFQLAADSSIEQGHSLTPFFSLQKFIVLRIHK